MRGEQGNLLLKLSRIAAGMSRHELARACGRSTRFIQRIENGDGPAALTPEVLKAISREVRVPEEILISFSKNRGGT